MGQNEIIKIVNKFVDSKKVITARRARIFTELFRFVLDNMQWTAAEEKERKADGFSSLVLNFSGDFKRRYLSKLFPRSPRTGIFEVGAKVYNDSKGKYSKEIINTYRDQRLSKVLIEQGVDFLIGGAACLFYPQNPITKKADIISIDPTTVSLGWRGQELVQFAYREKLTDEDGNDQEILTYADCDYFVTIGPGKKYKQSKNKFGFIPFSWVPCTPVPHQHEGKSEILSLMDLDIEQNDKVSDFSKRIKDNTLPHTNVFSSKGRTGGYKKGPRKVSYLGVEDRVEQEEVDENPAIIDYIKEIDSRMRRKVGLVDSGGEIKSVVSGLSLSYQYSDMMDLISHMRVHWDNGFRDLNNAILTYKFGSNIYYTDPVYHPALSYDSKQKVEEYEILLDHKLISRRDAIVELRGVENPDEKIKEIIAEDKLFDYLNKNDQFTDPGKKVNRRKLTN